MFSKQTDDASFHSGADQKGDFPLSSCRNRSGKHRDVELFEWSVCFETKHRRPLQLQCRYRAKNHSLPTSGLGLAGVVMRHSTKEPEGAYVCVCVFGAVDTGNFGLFQKCPRLRPDRCWVREAPNRKASCKSDHVQTVVVRVAQMLGPFIQITHSINTSNLVHVAPCSYNARLRNRFPLCRTRGHGTPEGGILTSTPFEPSPPRPISRQASSPQHAI